jgi:aminopeptidase
VYYEANIPTEECFTTPDCRRTEGKAKVTRPFLIHGTMIKGLTLTFVDGNIVDFKADEGEAAFAAYIQSDAAAKRLGEVALVGIDSPIYQSGRIFEEILYDENAACHIAIGFAYRYCIEGGDKMNSDELSAIGCNDSHVHTDMMISTEEVDVHAETYDGKRVSLICKGKWVSLT